MTLTKVTSVILANMKVPASIVLRDMQLNSCKPLVKLPTWWLLPFDSIIAPHRVQPNTTKVQQSQTRSGSWTYALAVLRMVCPCGA